MKKVFALMLLFIMSSGLFAQDYVYKNNKYTGKKDMVLNKDKITDTVINNYYYNYYIDSITGGVPMDSITGHREEIEALKDSITQHRTDIGEGGGSGMPEEAIKNGVPTLVIPKKMDSIWVEEYWFYYETDDTANRYWVTKNTVRMDTVAIGTTTPTRRFHFYDQGATLTISGLGGYPQYNAPAGQRHAFQVNGLTIADVQSTGMYLYQPYLSPWNPNTTQLGRSTSRFTKLYTAKITDNGTYVGINIANPSEMLHVTGDVYATDTVICGKAYKFPDGTIQTTASTGGGGSGDSTFVKIQADTIEAQNNDFVFIQDTLKLHVIKFLDGTTINGGLAGTIESTNQGEVLVRNAFINADEPDGNIQSFNWGFDSSPVWKLGVISDGTGGFDSAFAELILQNDTLHFNNDNDTTEIFNSHHDPIRINNSLVVTTNGSYTVTYTSNVSNPPTDGELDALISPAVSSAKGIEIFVIDSDSDNIYRVSSNGIYWFTWVGTKAL